MANRDVSRRFASAMVQIYNHQTVSLPILTRDAEIIFFYLADKIEGGFILKEICGIVERDYATSTVTIKKPQDFFSAEEVEKINKPQRIKSSDATMRTVIEYYDLHEEVLALGFRQATSDAEKDLLARYLSLFSSIVSRGKLRAIYYHLGKPMFQYIYAQTGLKLD